jgi:hypothetical protein
MHLLSIALAWSFDFQFGWEGQRMNHFTHFKPRVLPGAIYSLTPLGLL